MKGKATEVREDLPQDEDSAGNDDTAPTIDRIDELRKEYYIRRRDLFEGFEVHPLAEDMPWPPDYQIVDLAAAIERDGQIDPVLFYEGKVLDGKSRMVACKLLNAEPKTEIFTGTQDEALKVVSSNLHRRHLEKSQRAVVAYLLGERLIKLGGKISTGGKKARDVLGDKVGVSGRYVAECHDIDRVSRTLLLRVRNGELTLNAASGLATGLAKLPPEKRELLGELEVSKMRKTMNENDPPSRVGINVCGYKMIGPKVNERQAKAIRNRILATMRCVDKFASLMGVNYGRDIQSTPRWEVCWVEVPGITYGSEIVARIGVEQITQLAPACDAAAQHGDWWIERMGTKLAKDDAEQDIATSRARIEFDKTASSKAKKEQRHKDWEEDQASAHKWMSLA